MSLVEIWNNYRTFVMKIVGRECDLYVDCHFMGPFILQGKIYCSQGLRNLRGNPVETRTIQPIELIFLDFYRIANFDKFR